MLHNTQTRLPRLRDLDGPLSEDDEDEDEDERDEQSENNDDEKQAGQGGGFAAAALGSCELSDTEAEDSDCDPIPPLPQISDAGLPDSVRHKASRSRAPPDAAAGLQGEEEPMGNGGGELGFEGGVRGSGRLVASAVSMLEELERACFAASSRASSASLRSSMSRALRSVADHPGMRASISRHPVLAASASAGAARGGGAGAAGHVDDAKVGSMAGHVDNAKAGSMAETWRPLSSRPGSASSGGSLGAKLQGESLTGGFGPLLPLAPIGMGGQLPPVTPPVRSMSGARSSSARLRVLGADGRPMASGPLAQVEDDRPLTAASTQGTGGGGAVGEWGGCLGN